MKIKANAGYATILVGGVALGWILRNVWAKGQLSVNNLSARDITLVDGTGRKRAEFRADPGRTYLAFYDGSNQPRLTLNLDEHGPTMALQGVEDTNKIALSVNDPLRTVSVHVSARTSAINVVGTDEARVKLSDSISTDARSASLSVGPRVTKLRLSSDEAESELWAENELAPGKPNRSVSVKLNMRTARISRALLSVSSDEKPSFELWDSTSKIYGSPLSPR